MSTTDTRAAFEAWAAKEHPEAHHIIRDDGQYKHGGMRDWWPCWQAATEAAKATGTAGEVEHIHSPGEQADIGKRIRRVAKASGYVPDGTDEFYYAAAFAILGRAADALEQAARQPAPVVAVKTWQESAAAHLPELREVINSAPFADVRASYMATEIADLRAALAARNQP